METGVRILAELVCTIGSLIETFVTSTLVVANLATIFLLTVYV